MQAVDNCGLPGGISIAVLPNKKPAAKGRFDWGVLT
ncbi:hypothetical protein X740_03325 [Mesorhizobium sp. LNHC221B00]|nr:hypothetical protein X740_03325 [Mesorhizobium sp. LNHC221B00]